MKDHAKAWVRHAESSGSCAFKLDNGDRCGTLLRFAHRYEFLAYASNRRTE